MVVSLQDFLSRDELKAWCSVAERRELCRILGIGVENAEAIGLGSVQKENQLATIFLIPGSLLHQIENGIVAPMVENCCNDVLFYRYLNSRKKTLRKLELTPDCSVEFDPGSKSRFGSSLAHLYIQDHRNDNRKSGLHTFSSKRKSFKTWKDFFLERADSNERCREPDKNPRMTHSRPSEHVSERKVSDRSPGIIQMPVRRHQFSVTACGPMSPSSLEILNKFRKKNGQFNNRDEYEDIYWNGPSNGRGGGNHGRGNRNYYQHNEEEDTDFRNDYTDEERGDVEMQGDIIDRANLTLDDFSAYINNLLSGYDFACLGLLTKGNFTDEAWNSFPKEIDEKKETPTQIFTRKLYEELRRNTRLAFAECCANCILEFPVLWEKFGHDNVDLEFLIHNVSEQELAATLIEGIQVDKSAQKVAGEPKKMQRLTSFLRVSHIMSPGIDGKESLNGGLLNGIDCSPAKDHEERRRTNGRSGSRERGEAIQRPTVESILQVLESFVNTKTCVELQNLTQNATTNPHCCTIAAEAYVWCIHRRICIMLDMLCRAKLERGSNMFLDNPDGGVSCRVGVDTRNHYTLHTSNISSDFVESVTLLARFAKNYGVALAENNLIYDLELHRTFLPNLTDLCSQTIFRVLQPQVKSCVDRIEIMSGSGLSFSQYANTIGNPNAGVGNNNSSFGNNNYPFTSGPIDLFSIIDMALCSYGQHDFVVKALGQCIEKYCCLIREQVNADMILLEKINESSLSNKFPQEGLNNGTNGADTAASLAITSTDVKAYYERQTAESKSLITKILAFVNDIARLASSSLHKEAVVLEAFDDSEDECVRSVISEDDDSEAEITRTMWEQMEGQPMENRFPRFRTSQLISLKSSPRPRKSMPRKSTPQESVPSSLEKHPSPFPNARDVLQQAANDRLVLKKKQRLWRVMKKRLKAGKERSRNQELLCRFGSGRRNSVKPRSSVKQPRHSLSGALESCQAEQGSFVGRTVAALQKLNASLMSHLQRHIHNIVKPLGQMQITDWLEVDTVNRLRNEVYLPADENDPFRDSNDFRSSNGMVGKSVGFSDPVPPRHNQSTVVISNFLGGNLAGKEGELRDRAKSKVHDAADIAIFKRIMGTTALNDEQREILNGTKVDNSSTSSESGSKKDSGSKIENLLCGSSAAASSSSSYPVSTSGRNSLKAAASAAGNGVLQTPRGNVNKKCRPRIDLSSVLQELQDFINLLGRSIHKKSILKELVAVAWDAVTKAFAQALLNTSTEEKHRLRKVIEAAGLAAGINGLEQSWDYVFAPPKIEEDIKEAHIKENITLDRADSLFQLSERNLANLDTSNTYSDRAKRVSGVEHSGMTILAIDQQHDSHAMDQVLRGMDQGGLGGGVNSTHDPKCVSYDITNSQRLGELAFRRRTQHSEVERMSNAMEAISLSAIADPTTDDLPKTNAPASTICTPRTYNTPANFSTMAGISRIESESRFESFMSANGGTLNSSMETADIVSAVSVATQKQDSEKKFVLHPRGQEMKKIPAGSTTPHPPGALARNTSSSTSNASGRSMQLSSTKASHGDGRLHSDSSMNQSALSCASSVGKSSKYSRGGSRYSPGGTKKKKMKKPIIYVGPFGSMTSIANYRKSAEKKKKTTVCDSMLSERSTSKRTLTNIEEKPCENDADSEVSATLVATTADRSGSALTETEDTGKCGLGRLSSNSDYISIIESVKGDGVDHQTSAVTRAETLDSHEFEKVGCEKLAELGKVQRREKIPEPHVTDLFPFHRIVKEIRKRVDVVFLNEYTRILSGSNGKSRSNSASWESPTVGRRLGSPTAVQVGGCYGQDCYYSQECQKRSSIWDFFEDRIQPGLQYGTGSNGTHNTVARSDALRLLAESEKRPYDFSHLSEAKKFAANILSVDDSEMARNYTDAIALLSISEQCLQAAAQDKAAARDKNSILNGESGPGLELEAWPQEIRAREVGNAGNHVGYDADSGSNANGTSGQDIKFVQNESVVRRFSEIIDSREIMENGFDDQEEVVVVQQGERDFDFGKCQIDVMNLMCESGIAQVILGKQRSNESWQTSGARNFDEPWSVGGLPGGSLPGGNGTGGLDLNSRAARISVSPQESVTTILPSPLTSPTMNCPLGASRTSLEGSTTNLFGAASPTSEDVVNVFLRTDIWGFDTDEAPKSVDFLDPARRFGGWEALSLFSMRWRQVDVLEVIKNRKGSDEELVRVHYRGFDPKYDELIPDCPGKLQVRLRLTVDPDNNLLVGVPDTRNDPSWFKSGVLPFCTGSQTRISRCKKLGFVGDRGRDISRGVHDRDRSRDNSFERRNRSGGNNRDGDCEENDIVMDRRERMTTMKRNGSIYGTTVVHDEVNNSWINEQVDEHRSRSQPPEEKEPIIIIEEGPKNRRWRFVIPGPFYVPKLPSDEDNNGHQVSIESATSNENMQISINVQNNNERDDNLTRQTNGIRNDVVGIDHDTTRNLTSVSAPGKMREMATDTSHDIVSQQLLVTTSEGNYLSPPLDRNNNGGTGRGNVGHHGNGVMFCEAQTQIHMTTPPANLSTRQTLAHTVVCNQGRRSSTRSSTGARRWSKQLDDLVKMFY